MHSALLARAAVVILLLTALIAASAADRLPDSESGKRIYTAGDSGSGHEATATLAADATPISAALLPCVNCHGTDGRGKPEGGVIPSNVTWFELTKPYKTETANGRRRPPYTEATLARAIREGVDSANHPLNAAMPHYAIADADMSDLIAYLKILGQDKVPGVSDDAIRLATIVPASGAAAALGTQITAVLSAYFADAGEIHGRKVTVVPIAVPAVHQALRAAIEKEQPLALVSGVTSGIDATVNSVVEHDEVPLVLPITTNADSSSDNRQRFYLYASIDDQVAGLVKFAEGRLHHKLSRIAIVRSAAETLRLDGARNVVTIDGSAATATTKLIAEAKHADAILFLDAHYSLRSFATALGAVKPRAAFLFDGEVLPQDFFEAATTLPNVLVALPASPIDLTPEGLAEFRAFLEKHAIPRGHFASQLSAYTAAKLMIYALQKTGRALTRDSLRATLESVYQFDTGISPPLSFGHTRHIGSTRIDVARIDRAAKRLTPVGQFQVPP